MALFKINLRNITALDQFEGLQERLAQGPDYTKENGNRVWRLDGVTNLTTGEVFDTYVFARPGAKGAGIVMGDVWELV